MIRVARRFKSVGQAQRFVTAHAAVQNLFNLGRYLVRADHERSEVRASIGGGVPGFVKADSNCLHISLNMMDNYEDIVEGVGWGALFLVPTLKESLRVSGEAVLQVNDEVQNYFSVQDKNPKLVVQIDPEKVSVEISRALQRAELWPATPPELAFKAADIWKDHVKLSKLKGVQAKIAKVAVSVPGALQKGLDFDDEKNLY
jgi:hypothetical protein